MRKNIYFSQNVIYNSDGVIYMSILKKLRENKKLQQKDVCAALGIPQNTYSQYENEKRQPDRNTWIKIAKYFDVSVDYLLGNHDKADEELDFSKIPNLRPVKLKKFPVLGEIACGKPIYADERKSYIMADMDIHADFCLTAKGDSMINARIHDGDIVFIRKADMVDNGDIAAVIIDDEATLKKVYYYPEQNKLVLYPENPNYEPFLYIGEELNEIRILGKAVYFMSAL